jgi:group II intron reverse transcriptase/maturase
MALATPDEIRTQQRKLYRKAKQEPGFRFYALYDKVYRADILSHAYDRVRSNRGAPGIDGVTFEAIEADEGKAVFVAGLQEELKTKRYRCQPVRRVWIPKPNGEQRPLGIPTIRDRVVQMAVKLVMEPIFEADFCECSYGFRPKRSAHAAVDAVADALRAGHVQVIDADLSKYFDTIAHDKLMAVVAERIVDGGLLALLQQWLKAPVVEEGLDGRHRVSGGKGVRRGTPQGGVISPLLANVYLHLLDRIWERHDLERRYRARLVRYCDDFVVLCAGDVERPLAAVRRVLERLGLQLNEAKTQLVDARQTGFTFLGFWFGVRRSRRTGRRYPHVESSKQAVQRIKAEVRRLTGRGYTAVPLPQLVARLNTVLRGWARYFHHRNCSAVFSRLNAFVEERLRSQLCNRHRVALYRGGLKRFPRRRLHRVYHLFRLPTTAPWVHAHASR